MAATAPELKTQVRVLNRAITAFAVTTAPTIRAVRKTPMTDDQPAMPIEQRGWGHQPEPAQFLRQHTPEGGEHRPIRPGQSRATGREVLSGGAATALVPRGATGN